MHVTPRFLCNWEVAGSGSNMYSAEGKSQPFQSNKKTTLALNSLISLNTISYLQYFHTLSPSTLMSTVQGSPSISSDLVISIETLYNFAKKMYKWICGWDLHGGDKPEQSTQEFNNHLSWLSPFCRWGIGISWACRRNILSVIYVVSPQIHPPKGLSLGLILLRSIIDAKDYLSL